MNQRAIEAKLAEQLRKDRSKPSRCRQEGGVTIVEVSGTAVGLAMAVGYSSGESVSSVLARVDT